MERTMYKARVIAGEMLRARGYEIPESVTVIPFDEFRTRLAARDHLDLYAESDAPGAIYVKFFPMGTKKLHQSSIEKEVNSVKSKLTNADGIHIVFVCEEAPQSNLQNLLRSQKYRDVEVMTYDQLQLNPTEHFLVPHHELVPPEEEAGVLQRYNCTRGNISQEFPKLLASDPIARWFGMRPGRLCRITRISEVTGRSTYFRLVK
ncbi:g9199 [Coccomyxa viridis]|uniref:G9199 protein n=2 Tax=Coccomyxa viridis TaxID=1274662 RepID=A0ABP1G2C8_9CHLO